MQLRVSIKQLVAVCIQAYIFYVTAPYPSPKQPSLSLVDLELRQTSFTWSPVAPDCPAIHYNILASNCGSCPTTTNHTNVTCTEIPFEQNGEICALSLQTVVCGNVTGNMSDAARGLFRGNLKVAIQNINVCAIHCQFLLAITVEVNSGSTGAIASASILAIILLASVFVFTAIMIILIRANKRARLTESARRRAMLSATNSRYQEVEHRTSRASIAINKNVAYAKSPVSTDSSHCQTEPHVIERVYAEIS